MTENAISRYAGQLRPLTYRDMALLAELEREPDRRVGPGAGAGTGHGPRGAT